MGELFAVSRSADSSGPSEDSAGATPARRRPHKDAAGVRTAILFGLLLAVQFAAAALTPLGSDESDSLWDYFVMAAIGASVAWPALLAVWAVFGPQRAAVRLPLTLWLAVAVNLAESYGLRRNAGEIGAELLIINAAWLLAFGVFQPPLWLIRALRRWRLELAENGASAAETSVPHRIELWRRVEIVADWRRIGVQPSFADDGTITSLKCNQQPPFTDETCRRIAGLADLLVLDLSGSTIDDDRQLALLAPLARLEKLDLSATAVTDAGLKQVRQFPQLRDLNLTNTPITDAGLGHLKDLPRL